MACCLLFRRISTLFSHISGDHVTYPHSIILDTLITTTSLNFSLSSTSMFCSKNLSFPAIFLGFNAWLRVPPEYTAEALRSSLLVSLPSLAMTSLRPWLDCKKFSLAILLAARSFTLLTAQCQSQKYLYREVGDLEEIVRGKLEELCFVQTRPLFLDTRILLGREFQRLLSVRSPDDWFTSRFIGAACSCCVVATRSRVILYPS